MTTADGSPWTRVVSAMLYMVPILACLDVEAHASLLTLAKRAFFVQEIQLIQLSWQRPLVLSDAWKLPERLSLHTVRREFKYNVREPMFLLWAVARMVWRPMLPLLSLRFLIETCKVAHVMVIGYLFQCFDSASEYPWYHGYGAALALFVIKVACAQDRRIDYLIDGEFSRVENAIRFELFRLPLKPNGQRKFGDIRVPSRVLEDLRELLAKLARVCVQILALWPKFAALYYIVGWLAVLPIVSMVVMMAITWGFELLVGPNYYWSTPISNYDSISEVYQGIKAIKLFGWERMYLDPKLQEQNMQNQRLPWYAPAIRLAWFIIDIVDSASLRFTLFILFYVHTQSLALTGSALTSAYVLKLRSHVFNLGIGVENIILWLKDGRSQLGKIVMIQRALRGRPVHTLPRRDIGLNESRPEVVLDGCSFAWSQHSHDQALTDVTLRASGGELVAVVGKTGAGKSSLLLSICGELEMTAGTGGVTGSIAYLEQSPWIMNDTMRANVLFGREYDAEFFAKVIHACALTEDIAMWPNADLTVIGERGINISGGQRARLALARTLYSRADIYALDDPLSAVDAHVKRHILEHVLLDTGMLAGKLRIVTTNSGHILPYANQVVTLTGGRTEVMRQSPREYHAVGASEVSVEPPKAVPQDRVGSTEVKPVDKPDKVARSPWANAVYAIQLCGWPTFAALVLFAGIQPTVYYVLDGMELDMLKNRRAMLSHSNALHTITRFSDNIELYRQYASIEPEAPYVVDDCRPPPSWPQAGKIEFCDYTMRYREDLDPALKGINLTIQPGEKIGIVGRTGAGKSTLVKSLFRLVHDTTVGQILIDGQDIAEMGVGDLRPRLGIIPQESTMVSGSFKRNLDPLQEYTTKDMWAALVKSGIAPKVAPPGAPTDGVPGDGNYDEVYEEAMAESNNQWATSVLAMRMLMLRLYKRPKRQTNKLLQPWHGLDRIAQSGSQGFSAGEQQLFSLCRVLMRMRRIIVLDEATADVDLETDRHMQQVFRDAFAGCTVLTIAHRLETIMASDRIVVMDKGRIAEIGTPQELIEAGGLFAELVKANDFGSKPL
ncbi:ATP-binding cassette glutathione S-conjugate transporter ycf1 [Coemansia helicoidea]|uniref:ATP-binding cassette glutathione S-conjugate transporter ycf1 n=1 Tax=Coemansia helicoidea TaxID=1286919 RepID=A0ACC1LF33_9FUNG|nr:ATP-binding cassette glutathione S-conjugate transporter ycf1 [Coemansia helicoidea]